MLRHTADITNIKENYRNIRLMFTSKKFKRSVWAMRIVSKSTPNAGKEVVNALKFLKHIRITHIADILIYTLK